MCWVIVLWNQNNLTQFAVLYSQQINSPTLSSNRSSKAPPHGPNSYSRVTTAKRPRPGVWPASAPINPSERQWNTRRKHRWHGQMLVPTKPNQEETLPGLTARGGGGWTAWGCSRDTWRAVVQLHTISRWGCFHMNKSIGFMCSYTVCAAPSLSCRWHSGLNLRWWNVVIASLLN